GASGSFGHVDGCGFASHEEIRHRKRHRGRFLTDFVRFDVPSESLSARRSGIPNPRIDTNDRQFLYGTVRRASMETTVVVIGGGATGTGIVRDLAMRGFETTLVERGTLTDGTTGRTHGHLHSGARYAVSDQKSAVDCIRESRVLQQIASHCVEKTGGLFVQLEGDPDAYFEKKLDCCAECGIPTDVISREEALEQEPYLAPETKRAIRVLDHAVDPFRLAVANAADAIEHGARIETHSEV